MCSLRCRLLIGPLGLVKVCEITLLAFFFAALTSGTTLSRVSLSNGVNCQVGPLSAAVRNAALDSVNIYLINSVRLTRFWRAFPKLYLVTKFTARNNFSRV